MFELSSFCVAAFLLLHPTLSTAEEKTPTSIIYKFQERTLVYLDIRVSCAYCFG